MPVIELADEMAPMTYHGIAGVFISAMGFNALMVGIELERGDWMTKLARAGAELTIANNRVKAMEKGARSLELRAQLGLPLGIGIGVTAAVVIFGVLYGILNATKNVAQTVAPQLVRGLAW